MRNNRAKVFFSPIKSVQEFDARDSPQSVTAGKSYSSPVLTDTPDEFVGADPAHVNTYASVLVDLSGEGFFRDDLCRLFLLAFFVNNSVLGRISDVLAEHGIRTPVFADYRLIGGTRNIRDKDATERYRKFVREKYKLRFVGNTRLST